MARFAAGLVGIERVQPSLWEQRGMGDPTVYAIIEDGAHQYKVQEGDTLEVQLHDLADGQAVVEFDRVLMVGDGENPKIGQPHVEGAKVVASVAGEIKGDKITVVKFKRRKGYRRKQGHRQRYLRVKIDKIEA
ncbi:MAG: 50S ribosomal protein L21 [Planctomycetota bacterium]|jgi:large subunit ribosomal protein L21